MDKRKDTAIEAVLEHLIEHGPGDIATVFGRRRATPMRGAARPVRRDAGRGCALGSRKPGRAQAN